MLSVPSTRHAFIQPMCDNLTIDHLSTLTRPTTNDGAGLVNHPKLVEQRKGKRDWEKGWEGGEKRKERSGREARVVEERWATLLDRRKI